MFNIIMLLHYAGYLTAELIADALFVLVVTFIITNISYPLIKHRRIRFDRPLIQVKFNLHPQIKQEILGSWTSCLGGMTLVYVKSFLEKNGVLKLRTGVDHWGIAVYETFVLFFIFDFCYYLIHRFFFHSKYGWWIHSTHHKSIIVVPSTGFSFSFLECFIIGSLVPLIGGLFNMNHNTLFRLELFTTINTIFGHLGYEVVPFWWNRWWGTKWFVSSFYHDVHHMKINCNFGGLCTVYDRAFGTIHRNFYGLLERLEMQSKVSKENKINRVFVEDLMVNIKSGYL